MSISQPFEELQGWNSELKLITPISITGSNFGMMGVILEPWQPSWIFFKCPYLSYLKGVAIFLRVRLFRGDIIPPTKIPLCTDSEETSFRVGHRSEVPRVRGGKESRGAIVPRRHDRWKESEELKFRKMRRFLNLFKSTPDGRWTIESEKILTHLNIRYVLR